MFSSSLSIMSSSLNRSVWNIPTKIGILLTIGSIVGSEVSGKGIGKSIAAAAVFIAVLITVEWLTLKSNTVEQYLKGVAIHVIVKGQILADSLGGSAYL